MAEDREKFKAGDDTHRLGFGPFQHCAQMEEALQVQQALGFPTIIRPSFTMGGSGGGIAYNREEFVENLRTRPGSFTDQGAAD